jgi:tRNA/tmRNA/rRNA uracil-C5-methylase (TrmA/RlmC/RlmD family)
MTELVKVTKYLYNKHFMTNNHPNFDFTKLKLTNEALYSMNNPEESDVLIQIIKDNIKLNKTLIITDGTANVGGTTLNLAKYFKVNAIEINLLNGEALKNNIKEYKLEKNVTVYCDSFLNLMNKLEQDVIILDPPWGGVNYKTRKQLNLYLDNINLVDIVNQLKNVKLTLLKVPKNFNINYFLAKLNNSNIKIQKIYKNNKYLSYLIIIIINE